MSVKRIAVFIIIIAIIGWGGWWFWQQINQTSMGQSVTQMSRDHTEDISGVVYNSDPPTSGPHFSVWAKRGVYDRVISDGYLIHSLEHGYVVISYNCDKKISSVPKIFAHDASGSGEAAVPDPSASPSGKPLTHMNVTLSGGESWVTPDNPPAVEVPLSDSFQASECKDEVNQLASFLDKFQRLIIVPRPSLDAPIALTAWGHIDKLTTLNKDEIDKFLRVYHNRGPEKTVE